MFKYYNNTYVTSSVSSAVVPIIISRSLVLANTSPKASGIPVTNIKM